MTGARPNGLSPGSGGQTAYRFFAVFLAAFFAAFFAMVPPGMWLLSFGLCVRVSQQVG
jgi:hypothetical protein